MKGSHGYERKKLTSQAAISARIRKKGNREDDKQKRRGAETKKERARKRTCKESRKQEVYVTRISAQLSKVAVEVIDSLLDGGEVSCDDFHVLSQ